MNVKRMNFVLVITTLFSINVDILSISINISSLNFKEIILSIILIIITLKMQAEVRKFRNSLRSRN